MVRALLEAGVARTPTARGARRRRDGPGGDRGRGRRRRADVTVYTRRPAAIDELRPVAGGAGRRAWNTAPWDALRSSDVVPVVISTVPKGAADSLALADWSGRPVVFDAIYEPWPTPARRRAPGTRGARSCPGLDLLLWQAVDQFELFTSAQGAGRGDAGARLQSPR